MPKYPLVGSERQPLQGARSVGKADPSERLEVTVLVRRGASDKLKERMSKLAAGDKSAGHVTREEFAAEYGADPADIAAVKTFANTHGLAVVQEHAGRRTVILSGTVAQFNAAFDVDLQQFEHDGGSYRGRTGPVHLPDELKGIVEGVLGLDNRPAARPHFRGRLPQGNVNWHASATASTSFAPTQLAKLYDFPPGNGQGETIAIIELGGGYRLTDLNTYFSHLGLTPPKVIAASVDHGRNRPTGDPNGPDGEVMLDIEVAGAVAPGARIVVYFAPNTDAGFLDAITTAAHDTVNKPSVISISWGGPESSWTPQSLTAFDSAFQAAAAMGITVLAASGDNGSGDGVADGKDHVDFPASSPHVTGCGGTNVQASATAITSETVWNDGAQGGAGGGGVSMFFDLPAWQAGQHLTSVHGATSPLTKRGVPDIAGDADPQSGYNVRVDGQDTIIGGTSAVAPLWAGLIALINAKKGSPVGFINPALYKNDTTLNDVRQGNNGSFAASGAWDACTGLGSPIGAKLANVL
jgi:kumamolisin